MIIPQEVIIAKSKQLHETDAGSSANAVARPILLMAKRSPPQGSQVLPGTRSIVGRWRECLRWTEIVQWQSLFGNRGTISSAPRSEPVLVATDP